MSSIPKNRKELIHLIDTSFTKLSEELKLNGSDYSDTKCTEEWTIKELLAIRSWWTASVVKWIEAGQDGKVPTLPAKGYSWKETPKLNSDIAKKNKEKSYDSVLRGLNKEYKKLFIVIDSLDDDELLKTGVFEWAGDKWPVSRWLSVNTSSQYVTARKYIKKAIRSSESK